MAVCPKCGGTSMSIVMWDGARSGGSRLTCTSCKTVVEDHGCKMVSIKGHDVVLRW